MIKPDWNRFKTKFSENPHDAFEWFAYLLFCKEFNKPSGIFRYKNQSAIETEPVIMGEEVIGWQAKFYEDTLSRHKTDLLETIKKARRDYPNLTKLIFYTNSQWGQGRGANNAPKLKIEIEKKAKELNITIEWRIDSYFESPFVAIDQKIISSYFFSESPLIDLNPAKGWFPYENWSNPSQGLDEEFFISDEAVIFNDQNEKKPVLDGLNEVRNTLSKEQGVVRLVGLSGVGKTRFVQAVFDERIGENALDPLMVCYADMSREPNPSPLAMAETLFELKERVVLIVDNCPPDLHRELVKIVTKEKSHISLLTVEYDIKDDKPEETSVFKLEPNSIRVIEKILENRFPYIGYVDRGKIAEFSGGNARVAIALANTVGQGESLSGLRDSELFKRLFLQRHEQDNNLMKSAEALSLVYSFSGKETDENSELHFLAKIAGKDVYKLYRDVQELKKRGLVQERGVWRALLPQAIANRLAKQALEYMPPYIISKMILSSANERLIKSFAHRLSFLHDSTEAKEIVEKWLDEIGWLGKEECNFNDFGMVIFRYVAPVLPNKVLKCIERAAISRGEDFLSPSKNIETMEFVHILRHVAYETEYFERAVDLILEFLYFEKKNGKENSIEEILKSLFWPVLSGTHAPPHLRKVFIKKLLESENLIKQDIGFELLEASLETDYFTSPYGFDFGARPRDFGWEPKTNQEKSLWYSLFIEVCVNLALSEHRLSKRAKKLLADRFMGLWNNSFNFDLLEDVIRRLNEDEPWIEGWLAVKEAIRFDKERYSPEVLARISNLEKFLRPKTLYENALVFTQEDVNYAYECFDFEEDEERRKCEETLRKKAFETGENLVIEQELFLLLLPRIVTSNNYMLGVLLKGVISKYTDKKELWNVLYEQYRKTPKEKRRLDAINAVLGFWFENDMEFFNKTMDFLLEDEIFADYFPVLQINYLDKNGLRRLHKALDLNIAPLRRYIILAYGRSHERLSDEDLYELLEHILALDGGLEVASEILSMRFHGRTEEKHFEKLIELGYRILQQFPFLDASSSHSDHMIEIIAKTCFGNNHSETKVKIICENIITLFKNNYRRFDFHRFKKVLAVYYPSVFLDFIFNLENNKNNIHLIDRCKKIDVNIDDETILLWCKDKPDINIAFILKNIQIFDDNKNLRMIIYKLLEEYGDLEEGLELLYQSSISWSWINSEVNRYENCRLFLNGLKKSDNKIIRKWANRKYKEYLKVINDIKKIESEEESRIYERFE
ncbi:hypothetical protein NNO_1518 [Hydrogenimonas sp.]|nr:hypothetical protein NNO_1518 [Hydrogenimonas sp.]